MSDRELTWFGDPDDPSDRTYFTILAEGREAVYPDWEAEESIAIHHVTGSDRNDLFVDGFGPESLTLTLAFDDRDIYQAFRRRRHTTGTLQLLAGFTSLDTDPFHEAERHYVRFADVFLRAPTRVTHHVDGTVECQVAFLLVGGA